MKKLYFYPSARKSGYENLYSQNYKTSMGKYYEVVDKVGMQLGLSVCLLCHSFIADIYIFNWIETISSRRLGNIQYWIVRLCFWIIKQRKKKIVWMLHNIHPHGGIDKYSESITSYMLKNANLIISHSKAATALASSKAKGKVEYICHPVAPIIIPKAWDGSVEQCDVLIWGSILPYKGVLELISDKQIRESGFMFFIVGKCNDAKLSEQIISSCTDNIRYENRRASYSELSTLVGNARYVLFPYLHSSVSSSGALIDTIALGGTPVGPKVGAFKDLAEEGVCLLYDETEELLNILSSNNTIDETKRENFISSNNWNAFANKMNGLLNEIG